MKYKILNDTEKETYDIGYKVGNRQLIITNIQWENEEEHKIYRKGYMAGLMDYKRNNNVSNVSNVNNVDTITPTTPISISISKGNSNSKYKEKKEDILYLGDMKLVKLTKEENNKVMSKLHNTGRAEPTARYVKAIRKINAWMASGTKPTERYKNKTHYGLFAAGTWLWENLDYDIEAQRKFVEIRDEELNSINFNVDEQK